jgi:hypothetical protein
MPWHHIARKVCAEIPLGRSNDNPELEVLVDGRLKPIAVLEEQGFEMVNILPDQAGGGLPIGIFKRFIESEDSEKG